MPSWYPIAAMRQLRKPVLVRWGWVDGPFEAILANDRPRRWAAVIRDKKTGMAKDFVTLPPTRVKVGFLPQRTTDEMAPMSASQHDRWGPEPDAWRPIGPWPDPLPDPLPTADVSGEVRMVSIGKVAFDAASAAAEMEADRESARYRKDDADEDRHQIAWWRDASRIKYQAPGEVTREMAEGRIMRAVSWCGAGHGLSEGGVAVGRFLADIAALTLDEAVEAQEELLRRAIRFEPLRQDHDDFLVAMGWFAKLASRMAKLGISRAPWALSREQEVLLWRSLTVPLSFADIGSQLGVSGARARAIYGATIDSVHRLANAAAAVEPAILEVRERNRAARRSA